MERSENAAAEEAIPGITPRQLEAKMERGEPLVLVDVREPFEGEIADLPPYDTVRIPLGEFEERAGELDPAREIVLYCRTGNRSGWATSWLRERGYAQAWNLERGVMGWRDDVDPTLEAY